LTSRHLALIVLFLLACEPEEQASNYQDQGAHPIKVTSIEEGIEAFSLDDDFVLGKLSDNQLVNVITIMDVAKKQKFDEFTLLAIAFRESSFKTGLISKQGDVGVFQINARWWWKKLGYTNRADFIKKNQDVTTSAKNAIIILKKFKRFKTCRGDRVFACYNGGPGWQLSKNIEKITAYQKRVIRARYLISRHMKRWKQEIKGERSQSSP
jgi:hypothetical protein